jgi:glycosyltransferase involved in cell wall biosynthesis
VDAPRFEGRDEAAIDALRAKYSLGGKKVIVCVALMHDDRKGHKVLFQALRIVLREWPDLALVLVGDGRIRAELERYVAESGLSEKVIFCGAQHPNQIKHFFHVADVSVLPTFADAFANVVFESLVAATPVVSTAVGAPKDVLPLGPFGILCPPGDVAGLAEGIVRVLRDPASASRLTRDGATFVRREMSLRRRVDAFDRIYHAVVD